jgi:hypothetical protein
MVTEHSSQKTTAFGLNPFVINGFNSSDNENFELKDSTLDTPFCPEQKSRVRFKQNLSGGIVERLRQSENITALASAERIERCSNSKNVFVADDLHTTDGELYSANGSLWACNSIVCQNCAGKLSRQHRRTMRFVMKNEKLFVGENWYFITPTMPNLLLKGHSLDFVNLVFQKAFEFFTHRNNDVKKQTQYQKLIRGMFKNCEFTFTENEVFNFHAHLLVVAKSKIQRDNFSLIRSLWTNALKKAFKFYGIRFELNTSDGLAVVNVKKVDFSNREKVISELCKYVTKSKSWLDIPLAEIEKIVERPRRARMFEALGICRESAKKMRENSSENDAELTSNANNDTYLDTKKLIPRNTLKRRASWRVRIKEISLEQYKRELDFEILEVQEFRRRQLLWKYPFATFETLDGSRFARSG